MIKFPDIKGPTKDAAVIIPLAVIFPATPIFPPEVIPDAVVKLLEVIPDAVVKLLTVTSAVPSVRKSITL
jgi:hypothetical protein